MLFKFKFNDIVYSLSPAVGNVTGTYGSIFIYNKTTASPYIGLPLVPYKGITKPLGYSAGAYKIYYCSDYPSIHCRKNNTNYSCCNNYQYFTTSVWTFDYAYTGRTSKTVSYAENSYLGSSYNKYTYQTKLAPYGMVTPTRSGYTFKGWNTSADDTGSPYKHAGVTRPTDSDATFYALWARIDEGTYEGKNFWNLLTSWFGGEPEGTSYSSSKISNHKATITIASTAVSVNVGSTIRLYVYRHTDFFTTTATLDLEIDGTKYHIGYRNSVGSSGYDTVDISNGWLTDVYKPDIAKGTYSPSSFKNLISQFISVNGSRTVSQSFTAIVNKTTVTVPAGGTLYYRHPYTSNPDVYIVGFTSYLENIDKAATDTFSSGKTYVVYRSPQSGYFDKYTNYSITLAQDIKFN